MRDRRILTCVAAALIAGGCATSIPDESDSPTTPPGSPTTTGQAGQEGPPGLPGKTDAGGAQGAPFKIPAITLNTGLPIVVVERKVKGDIAAECPGCATVVVQQGTDTTKSRCQFANFSGAEPDPSDSEAAAPSVIVERGAQIILYTGTLAPIELPCGEENYLPATTPSESSTEPSTDEPPTSTVVPPSSSLPDVTPTE